jgi:hypothetical protein
MTKLLKAPEPGADEWILMRFWRPAHTWFFYRENGLVAVSCEDGNDDECLELPVFIRREVPYESGHWVAS